MRLCQQFELSVEYQRELNAMLEQVDSSIERHRRIIQASAAEANGASTKADGLQLFQQLFGNLPIPSSAILFNPSNHMQVVDNSHATQVKQILAPANTLALALKSQCPT